MISRSPEGEKVLLSVAHRAYLVNVIGKNSGFQNSRNEVQALLAEGFENSSVWSQHVTKGIMNVLYSITPFATFRNQSRRLRLGISPRDVSRGPKGEKVMLAVAHREYLVNVIVKNSNILSRGLQGLKNKHDQWNLATDSYCVFQIQVCKFPFEDAAYEMIWMGTLWFLVPAGFQSPQRLLAPRQWHAQGQAWRKATHEHDLGKNPSNPFGCGGSKCT